MDNLKKRLTNKKKGFTLVELLVVIAIIAILSVTAYIALGGQTIKARDAKRKEDLATMQNALELYFVENSKYPVSPIVQGDNIASGQVPKRYLSIIPIDPGPKKQPYPYVVSGATYEIGATLENDGSIPKYETYTVGAGTDLLKTAAGLGRYNNGGVLAACTDNLVIKAGPIGSSNAANNCIPYDPIN